MSWASTSSSSTPTALHVTIVNAGSAHPSFNVSIPASFIDAPRSRGRSCQPYVLIKLPPGLFLDPNTFPRQLKLPSSSLHGSRIVDQITLLEGSTPDWDYSRVELEGPIGYSVSSHERAMIANGKRSARRGGKEALVREYTAALLRLPRIPVPTVVNKHTEGGASALLEPKSQQIDILVPLHTRHPIAIGRSDAVLDHDGIIIDHLASAGEAILQPPKGQYTTLLLEHPHAFWSCSGQDALAVETGVYERTTVDDLLAPMHTHLRVPRDLTYNKHLYALLPPFGTSREPFRIRIPAGQAELGLLTQAVTFAGLLLASLFVVVNIRSSVRSLHH